MGGHSSGPSAYEIEASQKAAEEAEARRLEEERKEKNRKANESAGASTSASGGEGGTFSDGALARRKRGTTLAGEGAQTFGNGGSLGG